MRLVLASPFDRASRKGGSFFTRTATVLFSTRQVTDLASADDKLGVNSQLVILTQP